MDPETLRRYVAPCGELCYSCVAFCDGPIAEHARELARRLKGFGRLVSTFTTFEPRVAHYDGFRDLLSYLAEGTCGSCREGDACMPDCHVRACTRERGYDYCYQCDSFPCADVNFDGYLLEDWLYANRRMAEIGPHAFWQENRERGHYTPR